MPKGIPNSGAKSGANLSSPEIRAKAAERMKANRPMIQLKRLMKSIKTADLEPIDAQIAELRQQIAGLEQMRAIVAKIRGVEQQPKQPAGTPIEKQIEVYIEHSGPCSAAAIAQGLGMLATQVTTVLKENPKLFLPLPSGRWDLVN